MDLFSPLRLLRAALAVVAALVGTTHDASARTCLVLGGGGARGAAPHGVLKII
jgi:predicted acylesterase/phospholipase RssA